MPRQRDRFKLLKKQLRGSNGNYVGNPVLEDYVKFLTGQTKIVQRNKTPKAGRARRGISLLPFGLTAPASAPTSGATPTATNGLYQSFVTQNAYDAAITKLGISKVLFGWYAGSATLNDAIFYPAQAIMFLPGATVGGGTEAPTASVVDQQETSEITGRTVEEEIGRGYVIPFGRGGTVLADEQESRRLAIATAIRQNTVAKVGTITFKPEKFPNIRASYPDVPA